MTKKLRPCTVRLTDDTWTMLRKIAGDSGISVAEAIRYCVVSDLCRYVSSTTFVDAEQGEIMRKEVLELINVMTDIRMQLQRIGVNYNQQIKQINIANKYNPSMSLSAISDALPVQQIDDLITRYDTATAKAGDVLCRIVT